MYTESFVPLIPLISNRWNCLESAWGQSDPTNAGAYKSADIFPW